MLKTLTLTPDEQFYSRLLCTSLSWVLSDTSPHLLAALWRDYIKSKKINNALKLLKHTLIETEYRKQGDFR